MATTTEDETTIEIQTENGSTGPLPMSEFDDRADDALRRMRAEQSQLSFDLGTGRRDTPDFATLKISGQLLVEQDLLYGQPVTVTVTDSHGEVLAQGSAGVGYPAFKDHFDKNGGKTVERIHTATLE